MKLIIGLGNPGIQYANTRHNVGFNVVDLLAQRHGLVWNDRRAKALLATGVIANQKVVLAKPYTFMNDSGEAAQGLLHWYKLAVPDLIVVCDDVDLPAGRLRVRERGASGGQKGMQSIIDYLHTNEFARVRIGIGRPAVGRVEAGYVLGTIRGEAQELFAIAFETAADAIECILSEGIVTTMNTYNNPPKSTDG